MIGDSNTRSSLAPTAFALLLFIALLFGGNHVAARLAFDHGVDVVTAVAVRSSLTAIAVALIVWQHRVPLKLEAKHRWSLPAIGVLIAAQSHCLYSSVARIPVALALLAFNLYPLTTALWAWALYGHRAERRAWIAMPVILVGLEHRFQRPSARPGLRTRVRRLRRHEAAGLGGGFFEWVGFGRRVTVHKG